MAVVTRWFAFAPAGSADGTSWANRAALFVGGDWSTVITGFNFGGSDSLECRIAPDTYSCSQTLENALWSSAPTARNPLILHACDNSGNLWQPPDPGWTSARPAWDSSTMPTIATTTDIATINQANTVIRGIRFTASDRNGRILQNTSRLLEWCILENSTTGTTATCALIGIAKNCLFKVSGTEYASVAVAATLSMVENCRFEGNPSASGGTRRGFDTPTSTNNPYTWSRITVLNTAGNGFSLPNTNAAGLNLLSNFIVYKSGGDGVVLPGNANPTASTSCIGGIVVRSGGYGFTPTANNVNALVAGTRVRHNTSGNFDNLGNYPQYDILSTASGSADDDDAAEFVDAANGDFRIKATSALWGKGYGVEDEIPDPEDIAAEVWAYADRTLTS